MENIAYRKFATTGPEGLPHHLLPMRLYHKAKRLGAWDPLSINFEQDVLDWQRLTPREQGAILSLTALFQSGEESVTFDLLPLMLAIAQEGRIDEEMYLTTFLWEEAKHTEFFRRFLDEVVPGPVDLSQYHPPTYHTLFATELPQTMQVLLTDRSPSAQLRASVTYNMITEGVLGETGYVSYFDMLDQNNILPGLKQGVQLIKRDESRHIAYGVYLISRLLVENPTLWNVVEQRMNELLPLAVGMVQETSNIYAPEEEGGEPIFGLHVERYNDYAMMQFNKRLARIRKATTQNFEQFSESLVNEDEETL